MADGSYVNIRDNDLLGPFIGLRVVDITQHDADEFAETERAYVSLHFDNGQTVKFFITEEGFVIEDGDDG